MLHHGEGHDTPHGHHGHADRRAQEEGQQEQAGASLGVAWSELCRGWFSESWRQKGGRPKEGSEVDVPRASRGDLPDSRAPDLRGLGEPDNCSRYAGEKLQCPCLGRVPQPNRKLQSCRVWSLVSSWNSGLAGRRGCCKSKGKGSSSSTGLRSGFSGSRQLHLGRRADPRGTSPFWCFVIALSPFFGRWRAAVFEDSGPEMGGYMSVSPEGPRRLHPAAHQRREVCEEGRQGPQQRGGGSKETPQSQAKAEGPRRAQRLTRKLEASDADARKPDAVCHVPGQLASSIKVTALLNSFPRWLLKVPCGLQRFLQSILNTMERNDASTSAGGATWPMPLPFPEVFTAGSSRIPEAPLKRLVCLQVCTFDWLCLNMPDRAPGSLQLGRPLTSRQWGAVRNLMHLSMDGNTPELVAAPDMGRAAAKMENFEDQIAAVARALESLHGEYRPYFAGQLPRPGVYEGAADFGTHVGKANVELPQAAKPIVASRLHFTETPTFDPRPFFDDQTLELYDFPLSKGLNPEEQGEPPPVKIRATRAEKVKLFTKMATCGMIQPVEQGSFPDRFRSGLFCVPKDAERDRLVLDARPANCLTKSQNKWCAAMASASTLSQIQLAEDEVLIASGEDLKDFSTSSSSIRSGLLATSLQVD